MTDLWMDDVTEEVHVDDQSKCTFGVHILGETHEIHVSTETLAEDPEGVADALHSQVDAWLETYTTPAETIGDTDANPDDEGAMVDD